MSKQMREIVCTRCEKVRKVTPAESHFITMCKDCFIESMELGKCIIVDSDEDVQVRLKDKK